MHKKVGSTDLTPATRTPSARPREDEAFAPLGISRAAKVCVATLRIAPASGADQQNTGDATCKPMASHFKTSMAYKADATRCLKAWRSPAATPGRCCKPNA